MDKIEAGVTALLQDKDALRKQGHEAAKAIMTTDLIAKEVYLEEEIDGKKIVIAGIAKGSGMIAPNMGTMLAFFVTNAYCNPSELNAFLQAAVWESFNMVSVDNDTSTNDMALLFATGSKHQQFDSKKDRDKFQALLTKACVVLARLMAQDGEGAEHLIEVEVVGAAKKADAKKIALNVVNSPLVKTALHGADPNWGRIIAAAAKEPTIKLNTKKVELYMQDQLIFINEQGVDFDRENLIELLKQKEIKIKLNLNLGSKTATAWGCDLTKGYIDINTCYC
jgi:glutamate N-acetyltransferase/amino-acid N-acetyltransferase